MNNTESSNNGVNSKINITNSTRTPLKPKLINKNASELNLKATPHLDLSECKSNIQNRGNMTYNKEREGDINIDEFINYNSSKNYDLNHEDLEYIYKDIKLKMADFNLNNLNRTGSTAEDDSNYLDQDEKKILGRALDFFENENLIYIPYSDLKLKENIQKYIHEDLCFHEDAEEEIESGGNLQVDIVGK
jgi:hypothetical protein